jgi:anti-sigma-K factor RskA
VTKDKRQQSKWKRTVCWGVALTLLAAAVLIAVLAASKSYFILFSTKT